LISLIGYVMFNLNLIDKKMIFLTIFFDFLMYFVNNPVDKSKN